MNSMCTKAKTQLHYEVRTQSSQEVMITVIQWKSTFGLMNQDEMMGIE